MSFFFLSDIRVFVNLISFMENWGFANDKIDEKITYFTENLEMINEFNVEAYRLTHYKSFLMGVSMLWIVMFHAGLPLPILSYLKDIGYLGVDVFIFLSAYSLYFSFSRNGDLKTFYRKRAVRILPSYYLVLVSVWLVETYLFQEQTAPLWQLASMLGFYVPFLNWDYFLWYIPGILFLYAIFPFLYKHLSFIQKYGLGLFGIFLLLNLGYFLLVRSMDLKTTIFFCLPSRVVVFVLGMIYAQYERKVIATILPHSGYYICGALMVMVGMIVLRQMEVSSVVMTGLMLETLPFVFAMPGFYYLLIGCAHSSWLNRLFVFLGTYSLEIYLLHERLLYWSKPIGEIWGWDERIVKLGVMIILVPLAVLLSKFCSWIFAFLRGRRTSVMEMKE